MQIWTRGNMAHTLSMPTLFTLLTQQRWGECSVDFQQRLVVLEVVREPFRAKKDPYRPLGCLFCRCPHHSGKGLLENANVALKEEEGSVLTFSWRFSSLAGKARVYWDLVIFRGFLCPASPCPFFNTRKTCPSLINTKKKKSGQLARINTKKKKNNG